MFTTDNRTENFLTQLGARFEYRNSIKLPSEFAEGWGTDNIGRPEPVRDEAVLEYASLMESGSAAPGPVLIKTPGGYRVLDGMQRLHAAVLQDTTRISAYVVMTDSPDLIAMIRVLANARLQGRAEPAEWTRRRAVEVLVVQQGMTATEVASLGGWKSSEIQRIACAIELQDRITNIGGPEMPDNILSKLSPHLQAGGPLEQAQEPVIAFLHTIKKAKMSCQMSEPFIEEFFTPVKQRSNSHEQFRERLKELHGDPEIHARLTGRRKIDCPKDVTLLKELKAANTTLDDILTTGHAVNNVDEFFRLLEKIRSKLQSVSRNPEGQKARVPADMWSKYA
jgi:hypothetical protein